MFVNVTWPLEQAGDPHIAYARDYWKSVARFTNGYYTNEVANEPQRQLDENYQGNLARLRTLKAKYDPTNLFRLNANVKPA
jgi:FAD/FMN-containing dehydrogenase